MPTPGKIILSHLSISSKHLISRAEDFDKNGSTYTKSSYIDEVNLSIKKLQNIANNPTNNTHLYLHTLPETFRLFFTENYLYLSFFNKGESASKSRVLRIKKDTELFNGFSLYFDWIKTDLSLQVHDSNQDLAFLLEKATENEKLEIMESLWMDMDNAVSTPQTNKSNQETKQ